MNFDPNRRFHIAIKGCFILDPELSTEEQYGKKLATVGKPGDKGDAATFTLRDGVLRRNNRWVMGREQHGPPLPMPKPAVWSTDPGMLHRIDVASGRHGLGLVSEGGGFTTMEEADNVVFSMALALIHDLDTRDALQLHFID